MDVGVSSRKAGGGTDGGGVLVGALADALAEGGSMTGESYLLPAIFCSGTSIQLEFMLWG